MDLSRFLANRRVRTALMVVALAIGVVFAIDADSTLLRIAGASIGILLAILTKMMTEVYLLARKDSVRPAELIDAQARTELIELDRRVRELTESMERPIEQEEPARRHVLHNGPGPRDLRLRDMMDSVSPLASRGQTGADQESGSKEPVAGGSITPNA
jgi:hypothetical protein